MNNLILVSKNFNEFEYFLLCILILMPVSKKLADIFIDNVHIKRKLNQYTTWNIVMILFNYINTLYFGYNNLIIDKFIALNSFHILCYFHCFILYDKRILFEELQGVEPFIGKLIPVNGVSKRNLLSFEYFICNIILHILPVYFYKNSLVNYNEKGADINMYIYTICFKFVWVLNIIGHFNVTTIYVPKLDVCNIKIINLILLLDFLTDKLLNEITF